MSTRCPAKNLRSESNSRGLLSIDGIAPSGRFRPVNSINSPALAPYSIAFFASLSPRRCPAVALPSSQPPFCPPLSSSRPTLLPDENSDGDGDGNGDHHWRHCHHYLYPYCCHHRCHSSRCRLSRRRSSALPSLPSRGPRQRRSCRQRRRCGGRSGPAALSLPPSGAMDPTAAATTKTLDVPRQQLQWRQRRRRRRRRRQRRQRR